MPNPKPEPLLKLPTEQMAQLKAIEPDLKKARAALEALDGLGVDTKAIKDKLEWAEKVRETLLDQFS